ncbi:hypothetical protein MRX96_037236 [Rhipicephalus microplus]
MCTTISSTANVNFRWLRNGEELLKSSKVKIVHHSLFSTLVVGPTTTDDSGNYTCVGIMGQEADSYSQQLNILAPPKWVVEPGDITLHEGANATVSCEAKGNPVPSITWKLVSKAGGKETKAVGRNQLQINNASKHDAGSYECTADNDVRDAIAKTIVISIYESGTAVKVQPFSFPPKPVEGSRVSAACSLMRVSESTRFRWAKDGKALGDDPQGRIKTRTDTDFSMLTIDPARQEDSGNYTCTVMSKGKSDTFSARLIVYENIKVVPFYIPDKVLIGDTVKIVCYTNTVQAPLSFKWTKDGKTMHGDEYAQIKTHADLSTLILGPVKQSHTGNYTCQVHSPASGGSYTAPLLVYGPRPLNTGSDGSLQLLNIQKENNGTYSCTASNDVGNSLEKTISISVTGNVSAKTFAQYVVGSSCSRYFKTPSTDGRNTASRAVRQRESKTPYAAYIFQQEFSMVSVRLGVLVVFFLQRCFRCVFSAEPPEIQPMVFPTNLKEGAKFRAFCSATGSPPFTFKWLKNNQKLPEDDTVSTENAKDYNILVIGKLRKSHAGNYTCIVLNRVGKARHTSELVVNAPPAWTTEPTSGVVFLGNKLEIVCQSNGYPEPTVTWAKRGVSTASTVVPATTNATLRILNATKSDGGTYVCTATNRHGERLEKEVTVRVIVPARFEEKFKVQTVRRGEAATLQCQAIGDSPLEITWSQDKKRLIFAPVTRYEKFESNTENGVTSELVIPTTDRSDAALYTCVAKNEYGSDERNIKLLVVEVPAQPLDLRILEVWSRKVNVIWSEPYSGNSPINTYIVHYWRDRDGAHRLMEQSVPSSQTSAMISELHPGASYSLTVTAENEVGQGPPLGPGALPHRRRRARWITNRRLGRCQGTYIHRRFVEANPALLRLAMLSLGICSPPPRDTWNGVLKGYYVGYRAADSSQQPYSFKTVETVVNGSQEVTLVGLTKSSRYSVIVKAFTAIGSGPPLGSPAHVPLPPALTLISSTDSAFKVKWTRSKATVAPVTGYTLHYKKNAGPWHHIPVVASDDTSYTLTDLDGGATYKVYLTASNQFGRGSGSEAIIINTTNHGYDRNWVFYKDPSLLVPAASFLIAVLVVITVVTVCIKKTKAHKNFEKSLEAEKRQSYGEVTQQQQRYIDVTEKRNRSDYATIQSRRSLSGSYKIEELRSAAPNRGYNTTDAKDRRRSSLRKSSASSHVYDSAA